MNFYETSCKMYHFIGDVFSDHLQTDTLKE